MLTTARCLSLLHDGSHPWEDFMYINVADGRVLYVHKCGRWEGAICT